MHFAMLELVDEHQGTTPCANCVIIMHRLCSQKESIHSGLCSCSIITHILKHLGRRYVKIQPDKKLFGGEVVSDYFMSCHQVKRVFFYLPYKTNKIEPECLIDT